MIYQHLIEILKRVSRRYRVLFDWAALCIVWLGIALFGAALWLLQWQTGWASVWTAPVLAVVTLISSGIALWFAAKRTRDPAWVARKIESKHPELDSLLLTALEQRPEWPGGQLGFLQTAVIRDALAHNRRAKWHEDVPVVRTRGVQLAGLAALALLLLVIGEMASLGERERRADIDAPGGNSPGLPLRYDVTVAPGDAEVERGTSLVVTASFALDVPDNATLVYRDESNEASRLPMSLSLSDPMFGTRIVGVQSDLAYSVQYDEQSTREYRVSVYEHPRLQRADALLEFPHYTSMEQKRVEDTRRITAVEGTELTLICDLNKPVRSARLVDEDGNALDLTPDKENPTVYSVTKTIQASHRYRLNLADAEGRANKEPPEFVFNVTPNRRPDVRLAAPARDVRVSPIEELQTRASVWDDFGLTAYGVSYTLPGSPVQELALGESNEGNRRQEIEHLIEFESLDAEPDQLLAYHFWAEDVGPDGQPRRTMGDMYFAEVRHFEEIFRQGEQQPGGQSEQEQQQQQDGLQQPGQNAQQAEQLAELQKQIINATWTVIRRENGREPTAEFAADARELAASQRQAIEQLAELAGRLEDPQSSQYVSSVDGHMADALTALNEAGESASPDALQSALAAEQAAYQALLKLRAREHEVTRSSQPQSQQQSGSASGPQSRAQQQLEQLALDNSENRYETQRQASAQQEQEQEKRETLQVLNRLRELARRQNDLNKRLKELQSALEEAETDEEREDIQEQLKRLREQEQQMLRDMDELAERMEQPENQERMSQAQEQLQETRENIRQTTESLRDGQVSRAVASGTRAQRQLEEMREEFRKAASGQFEDEVRQLREEARQLHTDETELAERLEKLAQPRPKTQTLRDVDDRKVTDEAIRRQREDLQRLLDKIQATVEEAEEAEPLMTRELYDALRKARHEHVDDALDVTRQLLDRGFVDQARMAETQAARGIEQLKEGVEGAAESVLGDEDEALRRARDTLDQLARNLNDEMRRATGQPADEVRETAENAEQPSASPQQGEGQGPPGRQDPGQLASEDGQDTEQRPQGQGQPQDGQQPSGQPGGQKPSSTGEANGQASQDSTAQPPGDPPPQQTPGSGGSQRPTGLERFRQPDGPMTGDFLPWSDALRDVEEMLDDPELRTEAARIRDAARGMRREMRRDFKGPNWNLVRETVAVPLSELRDRVAEELLRRQSDETLVPIDRDPVPPEYVDQVRRYYEQLGGGQ